MALYRVVYRLSVGNGYIEEGEIVPETLFSADTLEKLLNKHAVSRVSTPPLAELPGWETRARKLQAAGIRDVEQFLEAKIETVVSVCKTSRSNVERWRGELQTLILPPPRDGCEGCR